MVRPLHERLGLVSERWVRWVTGRPRTILGVGILATLLLARVTVLGLGLNTDENDLFSEDLPYFDLRAESYRVLPVLADPIVVAVEGPSRPRAVRAADALAARLSHRTDAFLRVHRPGGGPFFERNGLLYLDLPELQSRVDELFAMQPWLAVLSRDPSLRGLFDLLGEAVGPAEGAGVDASELARVIDEVAAVVEARGSGERRILHWSEILSGSPTGPGGSREVLLLEPVVDFERLQPAAIPLAALRDAIRELGLDASDDLRVRATGLYVLSAEETTQASAQAGRAGIASFVLVAVLLTLGLGSVQLVAAALVTLVVGLVWTAAYAALAVGHVNLISVAFAVLFIGLSIDFGIHLCVRYRDVVAEGSERRAALAEAARRVGGSLWLCATTTALGFFAFLPTAFAGVAELGSIAGAGMFVSLFTNLTFLPALLALAPPPSPPRWRLPAWLGALLELPVRRPVAVLGATALFCAAATPFALRARFDASPLRVRDPSTASVQLLRDMLADGQAMLWSMNALAPDPESADRLAEDLSRLPSVAETITLSDFVPARQETKRALLEDAAYWIVPTIAQSPEGPPPSEGVRMAATRSLLDDLEAAARDPSRPRLAASTARLARALRGLLGSGASGDELTVLEDRLIADLPEELAALRRALSPEEISIDTLPPSILARMRALDGRIRVEIQPAGDLEHMEELERYVSDVQSVAPDAFGEALMILESGRTVVRAFLEALGLASVAIVLLLACLWRSLADTARVVVAMAVATWLLVGSAVAVGVPFNFANVIVIPLLLGLGVDTGIHLVQRVRSGAPGDGNVLRTSTARAVLLSAATTLASFGTLGFSSHGGMASLGRLLALGLGLILAANLVVLPALLSAGRDRRAPRS